MPCTGSTCYDASAPSNLGLVDHRADAREFLVSRRARVTPAETGLPVYDDKRRVPGLRREEVALLAGVSVDYYARLERGNLAGVSDSVLESVARALRLDEAEREHLFTLARSASSPTRAPRSSKPVTSLRPSIATILGGMTGTPAYVRNARMDILAANDLAFALYSGILSPDSLPMNFARFTFLDPRATGFFVGWEAIADSVVGTLRREAARQPSDRNLSDLIGELTTRSDPFATRWARHHVRIHRTAQKVIRSAVVGEIELTGDALEVPGDGLTLIAYTATAGSRAEEQLALLASWSAEQTPPGRTSDPVERT